MIISVHFLRLPSSLRPQCGSPPDWLQSGPTGIKVIFSSEPDNVSPSNMTFSWAPSSFISYKELLAFASFRFFLHMARTSTTMVKI